MSFRSRLRPVKRALAPAVERVWHGAFAIAGKMRGPSVRAWSSAGGQDVLVLAPHPDDEAIGCGGTVLRHIAAGDRVTIAIATDGRRAGALPDPARMAAQRHVEATNAAKLLQATQLEWLGLPEGEWPVTRLRDALGPLLARKPAIVYAPSRVDFHPEHHKVAHALALALQALPASQPMPTLRVYQVQVPLTAVLVNLVSDLASVRDESNAALCAHASQIGSIECTFRRRRYSALLHGIDGEAEEFWELPAPRYVELHRDTPDTWQGHYRGLRNLPFTDPLSWWVGIDGRRKLLAPSALPGSA